MDNSGCYYSLKDGHIITEEEYMRLPTHEKRNYVGDCDDLDEVTDFNEPPVDTEDGKPFDQERLDEERLPWPSPIGDPEKYDEFRDFEDMLPVSKSTRHGKVTTDVRYFRPLPESVASMEKDSYPGEDIEPD